MKSIQCTAYPPDQTPTDKEGLFAWHCAGAGEPNLLLDVEGETFGGSYEEVLQWMNEKADQTRAWILMGTRADGMESFLDSLPPAVLQVPVVGGASARPSTETGWTLPPGKDLCVLSIQEGEWESKTLLAHHPLDMKWTCTGTEKRRVTDIDGEVPVEQALRTVREENDLDPEDWDRVALLSDQGPLIHLHAENGGAACGRDLPNSRNVQPAIFLPDAFLKNIESQADRDSVLFGCAGLYALLGSERPWESLMPSTYLYGEIAPFKGGPQFTNLTCSILRRTA